MTAQNSENQPASAKIGKEHTHQERLQNSSGEGYRPALWERVTATCCAVATLIVVFIVILRKEPFADPNQVILIRTILSVAIAIIGAVIPGFLKIDLSAKGVSIRAGGALALFVLTFFFTPKVLPIAEIKSIDEIKEATKKTQSDISRLMLPLNPKRLDIHLALPPNSYTSKNPDFAEIAEHKVSTRGLGQSISAQVYFFKPPPKVEEIKSTVNLNEAAFSFLALGQDDMAAGSVGIDQLGNATMFLGPNIQESHIWSKGLSIRSIADLPGVFMLLDIHVTNNYTDLDVGEVWKMLPLLRPEFLVLRLDTLQLSIPAEKLKVLKSERSSVKYGFLFPDAVNDVFALVE